MVFLAKDTITGELVAIKCLSKASATKDCPAVDTDENSVELACHDRLDNHPNIVNLIHSFETKAHIYLVLEYCSMGDLYEAIRLDRGPLQTENVRDLMLQLVSAVDFMHSKGLYHRDIKPENIFLAQDGSMKLGDLGLATTDAWSHEACVGSDRYMAPEQYDPADHGYSPAKADIWAIGICLLNVLFSRNPFVTPTESDKLFTDFARTTKPFSTFSPTCLRILLMSWFTQWPSILPSGLCPLFAVLSRKSLASLPTRKSWMTFAPKLVRLLLQAQTGSLFAHRRSPALKLMKTVLSPGQGHFT